MHWHTLFGFALCQALCTNSAGKTTLVHQLALVMVQLGLYHEAVDAFHKVYKKLFKGQCRAQVSIFQVCVPDDQVWNFSDDDVLCILLYNCIPVKWVNHAYTYGMVYLEQQFHCLMMSLDIFQEVNNERLERLEVYGTPTAIPQWDGWCKMSEEDYYGLLFMRTKESMVVLFPEAISLYYYIGMDPNVGQLWKRMPAHGTMPSIGAATNIALTDCEMVDATAAGGSMTPPKKDSKPLISMINVATGEEVKTTDMGRDPLST
ncbi:hypothetical protein C0993_008971 [Termitomyces sp. T159_Od127]|nr:hypothetical protein C0993_008971 [Termitomyces sp. T159_Od127]